MAERIGSNSQNANIVQSTDLYDAFGNRTSAATVQPDPFGYEAQAGYYTDTETSLLLLTHRYYNPAQGRFLTRDPMGPDGGINLYSYTANNPGNEWDPEGYRPGRAGGKPPIAPSPPWQNTYPTVDGAATAGIQNIMPPTLKDGNERGGAIVPAPGGFRPTPPVPGGHNSMEMSLPPNAAGQYHSHPKPCPDTSDDGDQYDADYYRIPIYAGDPSGTIWKNVPRPSRHGGFVPPRDPDNPRTTDGPVRMKHGWRAR